MMILCSCICHKYIANLSRYSGGLRARGPGLTHGKSKNFLFTLESGLALGPTLSSIQRVLRESGRGLKLNTHLPLVSLSRKGAIPPLSRRSSCHIA
jgi:hypothetical protein